MPASMAERAQETLDVTIRELKRLGQGIAEDELARCKARAKSSLVMQQESTIARSSSIARDWYHLNRVTTLAEVRDKIDALSVKRRARLRRSPSGRRFHHPHDRAQTAGGTRVKFHETKLDNGISVIAELNPSVLSVAAAFFVRTGARDESTDVTA